LASLVGRFVLDVLAFIQPDRADIHNS